MKLTFSLSLYSLIPFSNSTENNARIMNNNETKNGSDLRLRITTK